VKDQGFLCLYQATEGLGIVFMFYTHWKALKLADIKQTFLFSLDPALRLKFYDQCEPTERGPAPVLDMGYGLPGPEDLVARMQIWLDLVSGAYHTKPIIYTNLKAYFRFVAGRFDDYPIWIARYNEKAPDLGNKKSWNFWQYANNGKIKGIKQQVDFNAFNGSHHQLESLCVKNLPSAGL
jgi:lysozyme